MRRSPLLLPKSLLLPSSPDKPCCGMASRGPAALPLGCALGQVHTRTCVLLLRQVDTVLCIAQAQLLVQTSVQVPPPSCRGPPSAEGAPGQQGSVPQPEPITHSELPEQAQFASLLCSTAPSLSTLPAHPILLLPGSELQSPSPLPGPGLCPSRPPLAPGSQRLSPPAPRGHGAAGLNPAPLFLLSSVAQSLPATAPAARHALRIGERRAERTARMASAPVPALRVSTQAGWDELGFLRSLRELGSQHRLHGKLCASFETIQLRAGLSSPPRVVGLDPPCPARPRGHGGHKPGGMTAPNGWHCSNPCVQGLRTGRELCRGGEGRLVSLSGVQGSPGVRSPSPVRLGSRWAWRG